MFAVLFSRTKSEYDFMLKVEIWSGKSNSSESNQGVILESKLQTSNVWENINYYKELPFRLPVTVIKQWPMWAE